MNALEVRTLTHEGKLDWARTEQDLPANLKIDNDWKLVTFAANLEDRQLLFAKGELAEQEDRFFLAVNDVAVELSHKDGKALHRSIIQTFMKLTCACGLAGKE